MPTFLLGEVAPHAAILDSVVVVVSREIIADESAGSLEAGIGQINGCNTELFQRRGRFPAKRKSVTALSHSGSPGPIPMRAVYPALFIVVVDDIDIFTCGG